MKYLVKETEYYFDGHGTGDAGATKIFITEDSDYANLDPEKYYDEDLEERDEENLYAEDGYNCTANDYEVKEISDEEAVRIKKIIDEYNKI